jgi:hypothetical protein
MIWYAPDSLHLAEFSRYLTHLATFSDKSIAYPYALW